MRILMAHLITGHTMSEDSVWSRLGVPYVVPFEELDKLKTMLHQIQIETLTTLEALSSRLANIEGKMAIIEKTIDRQESSDNVFDFISREELGIEENVDYPQQEYITDPESDEIRYIESGFSAPPPEDEEIVFDAGILFRCFSISRSVLEVPPFIWMQGFLLSFGKIAKIGFGLAISFINRSLPSQSTWGDNLCFLEISGIMYVGKFINWVCVVQAFFIGYLVYLLKDLDF